MLIPHLQVKLKNKNLLSLSLIFIGCVLIFFSLGYRLYSSTVLSFAKEPEASVGVPNKVLPARIMIAKIKTNLSIDTSTIIDGVWEISENNASYLDVSAGLGSNGNTVIYGHNKFSIFGKIRTLKPGDTLEILGSDGKIYAYVIEETVVVNPDAIEYVEPKSEETVTIYTCTGLFDSKRFVIVAKPIKEYF